MIALAHHWRCWIHGGLVKDQAALARLVGVSRARVTQVMDLLHLAPRIQESVLDGAAHGAQHPHVREPALRRIAREARWDLQLAAWRVLTSRPDAWDGRGSEDPCGRARADPGVQR
ncbi:MAG: hypothetical protein JNM10_04990 [Planctomycetia bacterium]|nr:hypothetical protein [Planctomycetia bacterium]